jgi:hypothetical protein
LKETPVQRALPVLALARSLPRPSRIKICVSAVCHASDSKATLSVLIVVMPNFDLAATVGFIDPLRAANFFDGRAHFRWIIASTSGGVVVASNGMRLETRPLSAIQD